MPRLPAAPRSILLAAAAAFAGFAVAGLAACDTPPGSPAPTQQAVAIADAHGAHARAGQPLTAEQLRVIAQVRAATARYHDLQVAKDAGYGNQEPKGCAASSDGAQGYHYLNAELADDAVVDPLRPELVMYEPQPGGGMQLVGVDYIIPYAHWPRENAPPTLLGMPLAQLDALGVWAIHIWAWRPNPDGMFAPWNKAVSCAFAAP